MGQKFSCSVHRRDYRFYCQNCKQFICESCIISHSGHHINHIDSISFDLSTGISKVISEIEFDIHVSSQALNYEDVSEYFVKCSNSIQFLISEANTFVSVLNSLFSSLKETIKIFQSKIQNVIDKQKNRKKELFDLNIKVLEFGERKDYNRLANLINKINDQLALSSMNSMMNSLNYEGKSRIKKLLEFFKIEITNFTKNINKFTSEVISSKRYLFSGIQDAFIDARNVSRDEKTLHESKINAGSNIIIESTSKVQHSNYFKSEFNEHISPQIMKKSDIIFPRNFDKSSRIRREELNDTLELKYESGNKTPHPINKSKLGIVNPGKVIKNFKF